MACRSKEFEISPLPLPFAVNYRKASSPMSLASYETILYRLLFGLLSLSQLAHADVIDDAIGTFQQAINDAYNSGSSPQQR